MAFYLEELTVRLATGVGQFPREDRRQLADFLLTAQQPDGGFSGREGASDIYYTSFALRSLAILGELHGDRAAHCAGYLQQQLQGQVANVDFFSLLYAAALLESASGIDIYEGADPGWPDRVSDQLQLLRRDDGGYAKAAEGMASSTYHSFLVLLCQQLVKRPLSEPERLVEFLLSQQAEEGGFHEIRASKRAGTNPTAAVAMMSRIVSEAEQSEQAVGGDVPRLFEPLARARALEVTEAVTVGAVSIAEQLEASLLVIPTLSGRTALAVSKERSPVPVLALSDSTTAARRMNLYWGVRSLGSIQTDTSPRRLLDAVCSWGRKLGVLQTGQRLVLVGSSNWSAAGHDLVMVHSVPPGE